MMTTTYHQTVSDCTGVDEANRENLLEALAHEAEDVKAVLKSFEEDESPIDTLRSAVVFCAIFWTVVGGIAYLVHHYAPRIDSWRLW
jgi:hypothetical protein